MPAPISSAFGRLASMAALERSAYANPRPQPIKLLVCEPRNRSHLADGFETSICFAHAYDHPGTGGANPRERLKLVLCCRVDIDFCGPRRRRLRLRLRLRLQR